MIFDEKIARFHAEIESHGLSKGLLDPAPWRLLRRAGLPLPPPPFQPMWFNMLLVFVVADVGLTALIALWPLIDPQAPLPLVLTFSFIATLASGVIAMLLAIGWFYHRWRLGLGSWRDYGD